MFLGDLGKDIVDGGHHLRAYQFSYVFLFAYCTESNFFISPHLLF